MGVFRLGGMTLSSLFKKAPTRRYPYEVREPYERTRGHVEMADIKGCILCGLCQKKCPADAIVVDRDAETWTIYPYKCIACNSCVKACSKKVLRMDTHYTAPMTKPEPVVYKKPPLTPEEQAEKERKEAERKAKVEAAKAAKKAKEDKAGQEGE
ncbi:MAG: 4Fe-4S binding protein [Coriobacteriaceae bacterium]|nr:4Fe-4S binding protein [Coriobacteriaceae bacterium]